MILFDLGAHFGIFSLAALHWGGPQARAIAVDASPVAARMIAFQAKANALADRLQILQACVCETSGLREMVPIGVLADGYYGSLQNTHTRQDAATVRATTLDELAQSTGLQPTHVKIDVEGFEEQVLLGGKAVLARRPGPIIFLELHNKIIREEQRNPEGVLDLLDSLGYEISHPDGEPAVRSEVLKSQLIRLLAKRAANTKRDS